MSNSSEPLSFAEFPSVSKSDWLQKVQQDLKGKTLERLYWKPEPGIRLAPFYTAEDIPAKRSEENTANVFRRGNIWHTEGNRWQMVQYVDMNSGEVISEIKGARNSEIQAFYLNGRELTKEILSEIHPEQHAIHLQLPGMPSLHLADLYLHLSLQGIRQAALTGTMVNDPISACVASGRKLQPEALADTKGAIDTSTGSPWFRALGLDMTYVQEYGGAVVHQLAFSLATVVEYIDLLARLNVDPETILRNLAITFSVGNQLYLEVAKFRAFRQLFAHLMGAYEINDPELLSPFILAKTGSWDLGMYDVHNNLLRTSTASLAAVLGGVNALIPTPFDQTRPGAGGNASRLAGNIQQLLKHESHLDAVQDPAGGAYYIEELTDQLCSAAWKMFLEIEKQGGFLSCVANGKVNGLMEAYRQIQMEQFAERKKVLIGVNQYPNPEESLHETELPKGKGRISEEFEKIRHEADRFGSVRGRRIRAFLYSFGDWKNE